MDELRELYQQVILDHNKNPRNYGYLDPHNREALGHNPLCGDALSLEVMVDEERDVVSGVAFHGEGCAISKASASIMTTVMKGLPVHEALLLIDTFQRIVTDKNPVDDEQLAELGKIAVFAGVREFPARVKCASLAWHTMRNALTDTETTATTE